MRGYWLNKQALWKFNHHYQQTKKQDDFDGFVYYGIGYNYYDRDYLFYGKYNIESDFTDLYYGGSYYVEH